MTINIQLFRGSPLWYRSDSQLMLHACMSAGASLTTAGANLNDNVSATPNSQPSTSKKVEKQQYDTPYQSSVHRVSFVHVDGFCGDR